MHILQFSHLYSPPIKTPDESNLGNIKFYIGFYGFFIYFFSSSVCFWRSVLWKCGLIVRFSWGFVVLIFYVLPCCVLFFFVILFEILSGFPLFCLKLPIQSKWSSNLYSPLEINDMNWWNLIWVFHLYHRSGFPGFAWCLASLFLGTLFFHWSSCFYLFFKHGGSWKR